jgi:hypothetical protein
MRSGKTLDDAVLKVLMDHKFRLGFSVEMTNSSEG